MSIERFIKENVKGISEKVYVAPDIPEKKLNAAIKSMAPTLDPDYVLAVIDTTLFGGAKDGGVITGMSLYLHPIGSSTSEIVLENLESAHYNEEEIIKNDGKTEIKQTVTVKFKDGDTKNISNLISGMNYVQVTEFLNGIVEKAADDCEFTMSSQLTPLSMMDEAIKMDYIKIMCNFAYYDDEIIDSKEYAEILSLIVRIEMKAEARLSIRAYMLDNSLHEENQIIFNRIAELSSDESYELIKKSILKDIIYLYRAKDKNCDWKDNEFIMELKAVLKISDEQIEYIVEAIVNDEEILANRKNDSEIAKSMKDLAAKATAVGVPMAAIYLSGSVVGVSAAGLTSGLATLGMGGILGFSGMVTGIGVAILLGVGAYKGVKKLTGISDIENNKQRELMIQAIIKNSQKSMSYLIEDLNELSRQLSIELSKGLITESKIQKLAKIIEMLSKGAESTTNKLDNAIKENVIAKLPKYLSETRVIELTGDATKVKYREFILSCYNEVVVRNEEGVSTTKYELNDLKSENELSQLLSILENLGYFNVKDATIASAKGFVKNVFSN